jgi:phosphonate transport system ATP-binding protein
MIGLRAGEIVFDGPAAEATESNFEHIYGRPIKSNDKLAN